jgi:hypothetical protein
LLSKDERRDPVVALLIRDSIFSTHGHREAARHDAGKPTQSAAIQTGVFIFVYVTVGKPQYMALANLTTAEITEKKRT